MDTTHTVTDMVREHKDGYIEAVEDLETRETELVEALRACAEYIGGQWADDPDNRPGALRMAEVALQNAEGG